MCRDVGGEAAGEKQAHWLDGSPVDLCASTQGDSDSPVA